MSKVGVKRREQLNRVLSAFGFPEYDKLEKAKDLWDSHPYTSKTKAKVNHNMVKVDEVKPKLMDKIKKIKNAFKGKSSKDIIDDFFSKS